MKLRRIRVIACVACGSLRHAVEDACGICGILLLPEGSRPVGVGDVVPEDDEQMPRREMKAANAGERELPKTPSTPSYDVSPWW